jgi:tetratricopeptide (TPR) repeat protein
LLIIGEFVYITNIMRGMRIILFLLIFALLSHSEVYAESMAEEYLCELGIKYYRSERYEDAMAEFKKVLMVDPVNKIAKDYINKMISRQEIIPVGVEEIEKGQEAQIIKRKQAVKKILDMVEARVEEERAAEIDTGLKRKVLVPKEKLKKFGEAERVNRERERYIEEAERHAEAKKLITKAERLAEAERKAEEERFAEAIISERQAWMPKETKALTLEEAVLKKEEGGLLPPLKITGETQIRLGVTSEETVWKRANFDMNERNWRVISDAAFNQRENTYDARTYDRLRINLDTDNEDGFNFHSNITVDPWSFTGRSDKVTVTSSGGDTAEIELKYWSNTGHTINETVYTLQNGDTINLPELRVNDSKASQTTITSAWGGSFTIPELKIHREFQPIRELWFDYQQNAAKFRLFPFAYQDQALTTDDPLRLSNNHIWWEDSPWLRRWKPGILNSGASPVDFTKGYWDDSISFFARDSEGTRLTSLRGLCFEFEPSDRTSIETTLATPRDPWQEYSDVDNITSATRLKHKLSDGLSIGTTYTMRMGFNLDEGSKTDSRNNVVGLDLGFELIEGIKTSFEIAHSESEYDLTNSQYRTESRGEAYYFSIIGRYPGRSIMDLKYGYDEIKQNTEEDFFAKTKVYVAHMDRGFDPSLSSYRHTRNDTFWSRHIHFRQPFEYYYTGLYYPSLKWDDIKPYRIGNGIDIGRDVIGWRLETSWQERLGSLFDLRNVHQTDGKYIETVARDEITWKINDKLTAKGLGLYHDLPKTKGGVDPFVFDSLTGRYFTNNQIEDGKNPSIKTGSLGLEYEFFDWLAVNGIWERTNDYSLGYDNFPRGVLKDDTTQSYTWREDGNIYRGDGNWLYSQQYFPSPPYAYYDVFKVGLKINPIQKLELYLDYTRNEYKGAGQINDNMNHVGMELVYSPTSKLGFYLKYVYSRWNNLNRLTAGENKTYVGSHNFFGELNYRVSEDEEFIVQYGEFGRAPVASVSDDPYGGSLSALDTQHIVRLFYSRRF